MNGQHGIDVTGQPDIDEATAEIAGYLRDANLGHNTLRHREQEFYDEAMRLRDAIMAGTRARAVFTVTRERVEELAGREVTEEEFARIGKAIGFSTVDECVMGAIEQVTGLADDDDEDVRPDGTVVLELANVQVVLTDQGFYARCTRCPWVTEHTASKSAARGWAQEHEDG